MKAVVQRVIYAKVKVSGDIIGQIEYGLLVLVGFGLEDTQSIIEKMAQKIINLRTFSDKSGKMNLSLKDVNGEILVIPQFTLHADLKGQNRPYFGEAAKPEAAQNLFDHFIEQFNKQGVKKVERGEFGAYMQVESVNDGPVTIIIDSNEI